MDADEAAGSSRRMDLNLYLGLPRAPRPRRSDLGSDLALSTPMPSSPSSSAASVDAPPPPEPPHPLYSPSRADLSPPPPEVYSSYHSEDPPALDGHLPYAPPPAPVIPELPDDLGFGFQPPPPLVRASELLGWEDRPSSSTASSSFLPDTAARYRRLLEQTGSRWLRTRRFRSDLPPLSSEAHPVGQDTAVPVPQHEPTNDTVENNKVIGDGMEVGASEESSEERGKSAATFECNICFEMANEPVVTSCGHLFCWPCLYQWLNVYSNHKECPICKGEVTEANITPIYGRGNPCSDAEKAVEDGKPPGPTIPPRPHGNRLESFRQQFHHLRPISRRLGEANGILSSWRRLLDQQIMNSVSRFEGPPESAQEIIDTAQHTSCQSRLATRMRARRLQREADNPPDGGFTAPDSGLPGNNASDPSRHGSSPLLPEGIDLLQRLRAEPSSLQTGHLPGLRLRRGSSAGASGGSSSRREQRGREQPAGAAQARAAAGGSSAGGSSRREQRRRERRPVGAARARARPVGAGAAQASGDRRERERPERAAAGGGGSNSASSGRREQHERRPAGARSLPRLRDFPGSATAYVHACTMYIY